MNTIKRNWIASVLAMSLVLTYGIAFAQEHPSEHPSEHPKEHSHEHPGAVQTNEVTKEDIAEAVTSYVEEDSDVKGGFFMVYDDVAQAPLVLTMKKVHRDRLSRVGADLYFVCADFATPEGKLYDLDIFMEGPDRDHLEVTEITVHKEQGNPRYTWFEKNGIWMKKAVR